MAEKKQENTQQNGSLSMDDLDTSSVLEDAEIWCKAETQLVIGSFIAAAIALVLGLMIVPTSVFH
jgi:hypothetical protein